MGVCVCARGMDERGKGLRGWKPFSYGNMKRKASSKSKISSRYLLDTHTHYLERIQTIAFRSSFPRWVSLFLLLYCAVPLPHLKVVIKNEPFTTDAGCVCCQQLAAAVVIFILLIPLCLSFSLSAAGRFARADKPYRKG